MRNWTVSQAKSDIERRLIAEVGFESLPDGRGWSILIESRIAMDGGGWLVDARTKQPREFKTLDAAARALIQLGITPAHLTVHTANDDEFQS